MIFMSQKHLIQAARKIIAESNRIVVFTGAGISTESGIPDFRSPGGLWTRFNPDKYANYRVFLKTPQFFWELEREINKMLEVAQPNAAHKAIVELEQQGKLIAIITQNIDFLHHKAGNTVPIYELHGSPRTAFCLDCQTEIDRTRLLEKMATEEIPRCDRCGGLIKPRTVLFQESMPNAALEGAYSAVKRCDCMIMVGSSLQVSPANLFPIEAQEHGAQLIFVNKEPTIFDDYATICLYGSAGEILPQIMKKME
jgi:NAD-dependent deacetylase